MESIRYYIDGAEHVLAGGESQAVSTEKAKKAETEKYGELMDKLEEVEEGLGLLARIADEYCRYLDDECEDSEAARELQDAYDKIKVVNTRLAAEDWNIQDLLHNL